MWGMKEITIVGLGPGGLEYLTLGAWEAISKTPGLYLRTGIHPAAEELNSRGISFTAFDYLYETKKSFSQVYCEITKALIERVQRDGELVYAVPGHPLVAEETVQQILKEAPRQDIKVRILSGVSFLDTAITQLGLDPSCGFLILDALSVEKEQLNTNMHTIFTQVYSRLAASDLKLILLEAYPPEQPVVVLKNSGIPGKEEAIPLDLAELDRGEYFNHLTSVYVRPGLSVAGQQKADYSAKPLFEVMRALLSPEGCPWDREQDHATLRPYLLEEAYEVIEAIDLKDMEKLEEELGDLLLQVVFHTVLAENRGDFSFSGVIEGITQKLVRRHPHVFSDVTVRNSQEVLKNWEQIKAKERGSTAAVPGKRVMDKLNRSLPALLLAEEVQKRAAKVGFDWEDIKGAWDKVSEEMDELKAACQDNNSSSIAEEMGDLLFAIVNVCRFLKVSPEIALLSGINKFLDRFAYLEDKIWENRAKWEEMDLETLDIIWEEAKKRCIR